MKVQQVPQPEVLQWNFISFSLGKTTKEADLNDTADSSRTDGMGADMEIEESSEGFGRSL